ncbi:retrotransposon protein, putative, ty1-copia subclass [Tanacetum coccineum]
MTTSVGNNSVFRSFFEKQKLTGPNFIDWYRQLRLVLSTEDKEYYLEHLIPVAPAAQPGHQIPPEDLATHAAWVKGQKEVVELKAMFSKQAEQETTEIKPAQDRHLPPMWWNLGMEKTAVYLTELMKKKKLSQGASASGIFTIELYSFPSKSWIYDTGCGTHICITTQGLRGSRKLKPGALSLHYAPSITRGIISVSRLYKDGFVNRFENDYSISVSRNNLIYFNDIPQDDIYEIVLSSSNTNDSSMYVISNKRAKINLDSALLWHCRLGHISKKRTEKLQHDGLLDSIDIKSFEKCVSCMFGNMVRKPYSHQVERAKDLLGLIHTDVCGPFKIMSRQGASYFVTFTDDFNRYEEVENQLGKTIKSLLCDRGGEYISQEFLDYLKEHLIIAHRTPLYTPQHNGVSGRRNRTLLNMVCSMMSQTTLPKSFWDYALESAVRILNMVPTKKVDKTLYEVWHGQAPKFSYLKVWVFVARNAEFFESKLLDLKASGSVEDLELIQEEDTNPSVDTSLTALLVLIHEVLDAMNDRKCYPMKDNDVWVLGELPPMLETGGSKVLFKDKKKKTDMMVQYTSISSFCSKGLHSNRGVVAYEETFFLLQTLKL